MSAPYLEEIEQAMGSEYTGREIHGFIRYVTEFGMKDGFCAFAFEVTGKEE